MEVAKKLQDAHGEEMVIKQQQWWGLCRYGCIFNYPNLVKINIFKMAGASQPAVFVVTWDNVAIVKISEMMDESIWKGLYKCPK